MHEGVFLALRTDATKLGRIRDSRNTNICDMETATSQTELILQSVLMLGQRLTVLEKTVTDIDEVVTATRVQKDWYTTGELAEALGKSQYTVQESLVQRWTDRMRERR